MDQMRRKFRIAKSIQVHRYAGSSVLETILRLFDGDTTPFSVVLTEAYFTLIIWSCGRNKDKIGLWSSRNPVCKLIAAFFSCDSFYQAIAIQKQFTRNCAQ